MEVAMIFILSLIVAISAFFIWRGAQKKVKEQRNPAFETTKRIAYVLMVLFIFVALVQFFTVIPAGHVGVVDFFGTVSDNTLKAGINFVNPMATVVKMSIQTQEIKETMDVPSKEGLTVQLEMSALFHLNPDRAADVYKTVEGGNYVDIILVPQFRAVSRGVTAGYEARALYTSEREMLTQLIQKDLAMKIEARGITVESTPLRRVGLPPDLTRAIEEKLRADQESQRMQFVLTKERQEAERKRIEAQGISDFQKIITLSISEQLLHWKGIETTEKLAASTNAKIVVIGAGKTGLPLIFDTK
jgi:regulator of protease activity HflC (stomatin/prohibitin superfamily)